MVLPPAERRRQLDALTALRFFAALAILVHHCNGVFWPAAELGPLDGGVSFFFVLSGFILTHVYRGSDLSAAARYRFYAARIIRIWPLHLLCLLLTALFVMVPEPFNAGVLAANLVLLHGWVPLDRYFFSYNYVSWSISTELFFYLALPFLVNRSQGRLLQLLMLALALVAVLVLLCHEDHLLTWQLTQDDLSSTGLLYANPLARMAEFMIGVLIGAVFVDRAATTNYANQSLWWSALELTCLGLFALAYRYLMLLAVPPPGSVGIEWFRHVGLTPVAALLIFIFAHQRGVVSRLLAHPWLVFLGEVSFALYLVHQLGLRWFQQEVGRLDVSGFLLYATGVLLTAVLLHLLVEKPLRSLIRRRPHATPHATQ